MRWIDLNADMGEYRNRDEAAREGQLMAYVSSCSIACGGHIGDSESMSRTLARAQECDVRIGAHPSYPDRDGFGRRPSAIEPPALKAALENQIAELLHHIEKYGATLFHIKPHGALYHAAATQMAIAEMVAACALAIGKDVAIIGSPNSCLEKAAQNARLNFYAEGFVDRRYLSDGSLTKRSEPGAVIASRDDRCSQALALAAGEEFEAANGHVRQFVKTLCIHSDSGGALETAIFVRNALEKNGYAIGYDL